MMNIGSAFRESNMRILNTETCEPTLNLYSHNVAVRVTHASRGSSVLSVSDSSKSDTVKRTIASVARMDAFVATAATCL